MDLTSIDTMDVISLWSDELAEYFRSIFEEQFLHFLYSLCNIVAWFFFIQLLQNIPYIVHSYMAKHPIITSFEACMPVSSSDTIRPFLQDSLKNLQKFSEAGLNH